MVGLGSGSQREVEDMALTRYACYLVAQNGDATKSEIAFAQTYFAVQTRKQEIIEQRNSCNIKQTIMPGQLIRNLFIRERRKYRKHE
jgi:hypothetical protein